MSSRISSWGCMMVDTPQWVKEVRKEIRRLTVRIDLLNAKIASDEHRSEDYEDLDNWTGWLHGLKWCLKMRDGTATRKDAWGRS